MILTGDCLEILPTLDAESVDSIVTDPPYGLSFMGKDWDHGIPGVHFWIECLRVAKPGAFMLAFGGTRTFHRLAVAIEDAGWEIRDTVMWVYGSGFPKSLNIGKAIDKMQGNERAVVSHYVAPDGQWRDCNNHKPNEEIRNPETHYGYKTSGFRPIDKGNTEWEGFGTALKPAWEPIIVARKPIVGTVAENVLKYGTGGLNIDASRIPFEDTPNPATNPLYRMEAGYKNKQASDIGSSSYSMKPEGSELLERNINKQGRWPANLIHDGSDEVVGLFPYSKSGAMLKSYTYTNTGFSLGVPTGETRQIHESNEGSASRFFYTAKASRSERGEENNHPTVKPLALMRYLCRLVTPPGGLILDPFMGSGSTGKAAIAEGFRFIGIDISPEYCEIAKKRIECVDPLFQEASL